MRDAREVVQPRKWVVTTLGERGSNTVWFRYKPFVAVSPTQMLEMVKANGCIFAEVHHSDEAFSFGERHFSGLESITWNPHSGVYVEVEIYRFYVSFISKNRGQGSVNAWYIIPAEQADRFFAESGYGVI